MNKEDTFSRIKNMMREISFFEEFSDEEIDFFSKNLSLRYFEADTRLFNEGDIGDFLFFIVEGKVEVRLEPTETKNVIVATFTRGSCVAKYTRYGNASATSGFASALSAPSDKLALTLFRNT